MSYFFTADWHLWHQKILLLAGRPFDDIETHNQVIQSNINHRVGPKDHLVIMGDVAFGSASRLSKWLDGLRCKNLHLVNGNHDDTVQTLVKREPGRFKRHGDVLQYQIPWPGRDKPVHVFCSHYAHRVWNKSHYGSYHVYGHSHGTLADDPNARSMDVGVDTNNFRPWSLDEIVALLDQRKFNPVDHHKDITGLPNDAICGFCGCEKGVHQKSTLHCPITPDTESYIPGEFHETQYFAPKPRS